MENIEKGYCRYFHIQALAEEDEEKSLFENIVHFSLESAETYPRQFIRFPGDWDRNTWVTGKIPELDGEGYLVPFILDEGPKGYKKLQEPEEWKNNSLRRILRYLWIPLLLILLLLFFLLSTTYNNEQS